jgi:DNA mismatch repair protein PMS2
MLINSPQPLCLSAAEEILALENLEVLQQNGFDIEVNEDENRDPSVPRLVLVGRPISKSTVFDMKG